MWIIVAIAACCGLMAIRVLVTVVTVHGMSMAPTLMPGDRVLVVRSPIRRARTGRIVVIANPAARSGPSQPTWLVKRVIAVAGDPVPADRVPMLEGNEVSVAPGRLVVLGDSTFASVDSRTFGYFATADLLGVVGWIWSVSPDEHGQGIRRVASPSRGGR